MMTLASQTMSGDLVPTITVICWTYNHQQFIRRAIDSILAQEVDVPVEVIIHDDASTDGTSQLIREYHARFPAVVRPVLQESNQLQQGVNFVPSLFSHARGKYIAICDGDDYWTCSDKLMKQLECMESSPSASGCFHSADDLIDVEEKMTLKHWKPAIVEKEYTLSHLFQYGNFAATSSLMLRSDVVCGLKGTMEETPHVDFVFLLAALRHGPLIFLDESMSVYRRHSGGLHSTTYGAISTFRALKSLVFGSHFLGLESHPSYLEAFRWRSSELEGYIKRDRARIDTLEAELLQVRTNYERARRSIFFRVGMLIDRTLRCLKLRGW